MDKFHYLLELVDKNANTIPEGDYIEICNILREIHEKVKPPRFLLDQNEPVQMPTYEPTQAIPSYEPIRLMLPGEREEFMRMHQT